MDRDGGSDDRDGDGTDGDGTDGAAADGRAALAWETRASTVAYTCPGFDVRHDDVRLPDGTESDFDYVDEPPAVVVLPFTESGSVVVVEEWRQAVGRVNRGLPAGSVEPADADVTAAARRELREETGYAAGALAHLVTVEPANGVANSVHHHFLAEGCTPAGEQRLDADETIRAAEVPFDDLRAAAADGSLRDGRAVTALAYLEAFGPDDPPAGPPGGS